MCFVVLEQPLAATEVDAFIYALSEHVGEAYDRAGRPDETYVVDALPKNLAAKIPRGLIRRAYEGQPLGDISNLDNPQCYFSNPINTYTREKV